jgi:Fe2+ or Zn2+ uptake regulation protein
MSLHIEPTGEEVRLRARLRSAGLRLTGHRRTILALFFASDQPVTTNDLRHRVLRENPLTSHVTVWRLLKVLADCGLATRIVSPADGILRYGPVKPESFVIP